MAVITIQNLVIPMAVVAYLTPRILSRLRRRNVSTRTDRTPVVFQLARRNIVRSLRLFLVGYVFCILPCNFVAFIYSFRLLSIELSYQLFHYSTCLYFANTIYVPIAFGFKWRRLQEGLRQLFSRQTNINQDLALFQI